MNRPLLNILISIAVIIVSCKSKDAAPKEEAADEKVESATPVTVGPVEKGTMQDYVDLNATSVFLTKSYVKAIANGYLQNVNAKPGEYVSKGKVLFTLKTKEAETLGNTINVLDSSFRFSGIINIKSNGDGYIAQLNHQGGDYVQDGEQLAVINDANSFSFILALPYELKNYLASNKTLEVLLPDSTKLQGYVASYMPTVDSASQTQNIVIKVNSKTMLPENLIGKVRIVKTSHPNTVYVPKAAVLADETQSNFWIMKLIDSTTAVKVPVIKGIETNDKVEIKSPALSTTDKILVTGNYGLPDTAKVSVAHD